MCTISLFTSYLRFDYLSLQYILNYLRFILCNIKNSQIQKNYFFLMQVKKTNKRKSSYLIEANVANKHDEEIVKVVNIEENSSSEKKDQSEDFQDDDISQQVKPIQLKQRKTKMTKLADIAKKFIWIITRERDQRMSISKAAKKVGVPKRRIYDIVNVLQGVELAQHSKGKSIQWLGCKPLESSPIQDACPIDAQIADIDKMIQEKEQEIEEIMNGQNKQYLFFLNNDFSQIQKAKDQFSMHYLRSLQNLIGIKEKQGRVRQEEKQNKSANQITVENPYKRLEEGVNDFLVASLPPNSNIEYSIQTFPNDQRIKKTVSVVWSQNRQEKKAFQKNIAVYTFKSRFSKLFYKDKLLGEASIGTRKLERENKCTLKFEEIIDCKAKRQSSFE